MCETYLKYKDWWMEYESPHKVPSGYWGNTGEEAFEQHVKDMGLYELMETLANWG
jgi:hypothetical protein